MSEPKPRRDARIPVGAAAILFCGLCHAAEPGASLPWSLTLAGGGDYSDDVSGGAPYAGVTIRRAFGAQSLSAGFGYSTTNVASTAVSNNVEAKTLQGTLGYGLDIGRFTFESHASYGNRKFEPVIVTIANPLPGRPPREVQTAADGSQYGLGALVSADYGALDVVRYSPYVAVDWSRIDTATQRDTTGGDEVALASERETGVTGTFGLSLTHGFGASYDFPVRLTADAALLVSSNGSAFTAGAGRNGNTVSNNYVQPAGSNGSQTWGQYGATLSIDLGPRTTFGFSALRSAGFKPADYTSAGATLGVNF